MFFYAGHVRKLSSRTEAIVGADVPALSRTSPFWNIGTGLDGGLPLRPWEQYFNSYHEIDIGLDTFPYNGHTTSMDSMWMGVPCSSLTC